MSHKFDKSMIKNMLIFKIKKKMFIYHEFLYSIRSRVF